MIYCLFDRWKEKEVHDIIVECAQLSLDPVEVGPGTGTTVDESPRRKTTADKGILLKVYLFVVFNALIRD